MKRTGGKGLSFSFLRFGTTDQNVTAVGQSGGKDVGVAALFQPQSFPQSGYAVREVPHRQIGLPYVADKSFQFFLAESAAGCDAERPSGKVGPKSVRGVKV